MVSVTNVGMAIGVYLLVIPILLFYSLLLASCTSSSPGLPNLHLFQIQETGQASVRAGYLGICLMGTANANIRCTWAGFSSSEVIITRLLEINSGASILPTAVEIAVKLQRRVFLNILALGGILFLVGLIIDLLQIYSTMRSRKVAVLPSTRRRQNFYRQTSLALAWAACACTLAAALANTQAVHALRIESDGLVSAGRNSLGIHWATTALLFIFCTGWTMLHRTKSGAKPGSEGSEFSNFNATQPLAAGAAPMGIVTL